MNYVNNNIDFGSDAEVKLFGGPIYDTPLVKATPTTLTVQLNLNEDYLPVAEGENVPIITTQFDLYANNGKVRRSRRLTFPCYNNANAPTPYRKERGRRYMYVYVPRFLSQILNQDVDVLGFAQAAQGAFLDLAHTLAGEVE